MASDSFWWCALCRTRVDDKRVTWEDYHEGCGGRCVVLDEEADVFEEARAWQAFRDWCDGTAEQWPARCEQHFIDGQLQIALGHFPLHVRDKFEKRMTAEAIAQYERLQDHD